MIPTRRRKRERLRAKPFDPEWRRIIETNVPMYSRLPDDDKTELLGHVQVFIAEKLWEGCGGLELTDEIRVTIAAQACILLLHRDTDYYPKVKVILVYPSIYVEEGERNVGGGIWEAGEQHRLGHTQQQLGAIVLAWDAALHGSRVYDDGHNLVLHEFAHQLDFEGMGTDGTPLLDTRQQYLSWARVLGAEYEQLRKLDDAGELSILNAYGATNPAEFFAVVTEFFFERPAELLAKHQALYEELKGFYRQDPAELSI
ncbi:MAG: M90 family metallopeptidase [Gemmatimonadaceae bacterium]